MSTIKLVMQDVTKTQNAEMVKQTNMKNVCSCVVWVCVEWGIPPKKVYPPANDEEKIKRRKCVAKKVYI